MFSRRGHSANLFDLRVEHRSVLPRVDLSKGNEPRQRVDSFDCINKILGLTFLSTDINDADTIRVEMGRYAQNRLSLGAL